MDTIGCIGGGKRWSRNFLPRFFHFAHFSRHTDSSFFLPILRQFCESRKKYWICFVYGHPTRRNRRTRFLIHGAVYLKRCLGAHHHTNRQEIYSSRRGNLKAALILSDSIRSAPQAVDSFRRSPSCMFQSVSYKSICLAR